MPREFKSQWDASGQIRREAMAAGLFIYDIVFSSYRGPQRSAE